MGQQVRPFLQQTASAHGQQPSFEAEKIDEQQVWVLGQRVWFMPGGPAAQASGQGAASGSAPPTTGGFCTILNLKWSDL